MSSFHCNPHFKRVEFWHRTPSQRPACARQFRYAFLAPDIVRAIVDGRQPVGLTSSYLLRHPFPR